ncbi:hypothetical protein EV179_001350, partial [Coemansia sp. RSA 487]
MVFGWQKSHKPARASTAPQMALTRHCANRNGSIASTILSRQTAAIPVPETIAEDGCEVVPQFFPGVVPTNVPAIVSPHSASRPPPHTALTIDTNVLHGGQYRSARASSQRRAGSIKAASSAGSDVVGTGESYMDLRGPRSAPPYQSAHEPRRSSNGSSVSSASSASTFAIYAVSPPFAQ